SSHARTHTPHHLLHSVLCTLGYIYTAFCAQQIKALSKLHTLMICPLTAAHTVPTNTYIITVACVHTHTHINTHTHTLHLPTHTISESCVHTHTHTNTHTQTHTHTHTQTHTHTHTHTHT